VDLNVYRIALVWVLRVGAVIVLLTSVGTLVSVVRDAGSNPVMSLYSMAQFLMNPLLALAIAEILALLNKRSSVN
jgi:hypothetical protein